MTALCLLVAILAGQATQPVTFHQALTIGPLGVGGRIPVPTNALLDKIVHGRFESPKESEEVASTTGEVKKWRTLKVGEDGWFSSEDFSGGFAFFSFDSHVERVMALDAAGHSYVYVNGEPRCGDPYSYGSVRVPVAIKKGLNTFLFSVGRGRLRFQLVAIESGVFIEARDSTLPDLIVGESGDQVGAVVVTNATPLTMQGFVLSARVGSDIPFANRLPDLPPLSSIKVPFHFKWRVGLPDDLAVLSLSLADKVGVSTGQPVTFDLAVKQPYHQHKRTFVSKIDGSVQYYAVQPPFKENLATADALVLSVHGAGVEATGQAGAYGQKSWATLVAPTNRRPYGFDWEDWGRLDALEALADAKRIYKPREDRIYLTGHSMGGHGAWYLGATHPDQWGAIGPAAGWINFWSYGGAVAFDNPDPIEQVLLRVSSPSDPLKIIDNYSAFGVYVLHGDADDTVPLQQARDMREKLSAFHRDVDFHDQPGGGHWYDSTPEPGADCVDYGPMFEFFDRHRRRLSKDVRSFKFSTVCPQVSATCHWATIYSQIAPFLTSSIAASNPTGTRQFDVATTNVSRMILDLEKSQLAESQSPIEAKIDGTEIKEITPIKGKAHFQFESGAWRSVPPFSMTEKSPENGGPFKAVFNNRFVLVYGTTGTAEENAWSYSKARYDSETWWYRGNGYAEIAADTDCTRRNAFRRTTNLIIYGNETSNALAKHLLSNSPIHVKRGSMTVKDRTLKGEDISILMIRPIPYFGERSRASDFEPQSFAIVGGTGMAGMRATNTMPYLVSGVHYPDLLVFRSSIHREGTKAIEVAGIFGNDWSVENGEFAWRK